jgi:hypothetical protein
MVSAYFSRQIIATVYLAEFLLSVSSTWFCIDISSKSLREGVVWNTKNCTMDSSLPPLLTVNSIHTDLTRSDVRVVSAIADPVIKLQSLPDMSKQNENFIAGINGGYFWRVDIDGIWVDNVCRGKTRAEAEQPASDENVNYGIGDGTVKIDGHSFSNNCNCSGYSRPAVIKLEGVDSYIDVLHRGEQVDKSVNNAIAAGPNLLSYDFSTQESYVDIPDDDDNINRLVYEASSSIGLVLDKSSKDSKTSKALSLVMVATDGSDSCLPKDTDCGVIAPNLATLLKEVYSLDVAMSLDQGKLLML